MPAESYAFSRGPRSAKRTEEQRSVLSSRKDYSCGMTFRRPFLFLLLACCGCHSVAPEAPLVGQWQFQQTEQLVCRPDGTVVEKIVQRPPQASERWLEVTSTQLITHHVRDPSYPGERRYAEARSYTRRDSTLWVVPSPEIDALPVRIRRLTDHQLTLWSKLGVPGAGGPQ